MPWAEGCADNKATRDVTRKISEILDCFTEVRNFGRRDVARCGPSKRLTLSNYRAFRIGKIEYVEFSRRNWQGHL